MFDVGVKMTSRPSARASLTSESSVSKAPAGYELGSEASKPAGLVRESGEGAIRRQPTSTWTVSAPSAFIWFRADFWASAPDSCRTPSSWKIDSWLRLAAAGAASRREIRAAAASPVKVGQCPTTLGLRIVGIAKLNRLSESKLRQRQGTVAAMTPERSRPYLHAGGHPDPPGTRGKVAVRFGAARRRTGLARTHLFGTGDRWLHVSS